MTDIIPSTIVHPGELAPHPLNSNQHPNSHIRQLADGLDEFSQYRNIVTWTAPETIETEDKNGQPVILKKGITYVLAGNGLLEAALKRGDDQIEVKDHGPHLSFEESIGLLEYDNASTLGSQPDPQQLQANLELARTALWEKRPNLEDMMKKAREMAGVVDGANGAGKDTEPQVDKAAELQEKWGTKLGQLWQLGEHRLICGDCTDAAVVERVMGGEEARLEFSDPPYDFETEGGGIRTESRHMDEIQKAGISEFDPLSLRLIARTSVFCCNKSLIRSYIDLAEATKQAWDLCFYKKENTPPNYGGHLMTDTEYLPVIGKQSPNSGMEKAIYSKSYIGKLDDNHYVAWAKPVGLVEKFARLFSIQNEIILDRYSGTGTTLIAADNLGRKCRGIEINPGYVAVTLQRFLDHTNIQPRLIE